ncbi:MAG TPA: hypothetical protein VHF25_08055 [Nitriliruptorales bacterium]|nr:hypothetical protein [Nitriliruptorales bacterium]
MAPAANSTESARSFARRMARRHMSIVAHYGQALQDYADSLGRYVKGEIEATELGKDVMRLAADQASRTAENTIELGAEYYRWVWSIVGVRTRDDEAAAENDQASDDAPNGSPTVSGRR